MRKALTRAIKLLIVSTLFYSGIAWLVATMKFRRRATVLMYHRVLPVDRRSDVHSSRSIVVSDTSFARHMAFLNRYFNPVNSDQLLAMLEGRTPWIPRCCLITFDDGWFDNIEYALPLLEHSRVPATFFLATAFVGSDETFWQERLSRLLTASWKTGEHSKTMFDDLGESSILSLSEADARDSIREIVTRAKSLPRESVDALLERTRSFLSQHPETSGGIGDDHFMSWTDAGRLAKNVLVTIGSHAHSHTPLSLLPRSLVAEELRMAKEHFMTRAALDTSYLAYPNGDFNDGVVDEARAAGYKLAFTTRVGWVSRGDDPLRLNRINIGEPGTETTAGLMCRILGWL